MIILYDEFFEARNHIQLPSEEMDLYKLTDIYNKGIKEFTGEDSVKELLIWDYELMNCVERPLHINGNKNNRLVAMFGWENGYVWPDINHFEETRIPFYNECVGRTENTAMKIRYLDYLVDSGQSDLKYSYARSLIAELLPISQVFDGDYIQYYSRISRVIDISIKFGMNEVITQAERSLTTEAQNIIRDKGYRWLFEVSELLHCLCYSKTNKRIQQSSIDQIIAYLSEAREQMLKNKDSHFYRKFSWHLLNWYKSEKISEDDCKLILVQIGESFEQESEYQEGREEKSSLLKAHYLEQAVQHYINIGERHRIPELKVKIKNAYKAVEQNNELQVISTKIDIPIETIQSEINKFKLDDINKSFEQLSRTSYFVPSKENIKKMTEEIDKEAVFSKLLNLATIYNGRKIFQSENEEETFKYNFYQNYSRYLQNDFGVFFMAIWDELIKDGLTVGMVIDRVTTWEYMSEENKVIIEQGIRRMFECDYVSAVHILVPRFESCLREFFDCYGYATTSIKPKTVQHEQTFNEFLENDFVKINIEKNLYFLIKFVMVDEIGYNLRNNVAHGLANLANFNKLIALIIIYLYFQITLYGWKTTQEEA